MENEEKNKNDVQALVVCHPDMKAHLLEEGGKEAPPDDIFVTTSIISPEYAFVVPVNDFIEWLWEHNEGLWQTREEEKK